MSEKIQGYLVVLTEPEYKSELSKKYKGIDRIPAYPSKITQEEAAMDLYVFGDYKNENYFIPSLEKALELQQAFLPSPRTFEVIFCRNHKLGNSFIPNHLFMGYDIAGIGDFWSILGDFPRHPDMQKYLTLLNDFGLFEQAATADEFLNAYKQLKLADHDTKFFVIELFEVPLS